MNELPLSVLGLLAALLIFYIGFGTCFAETKAVQNMRLWPFRRGIVAVRFQASPLPPLTPGRRGTASGVEYQVVGPADCVFVEEGWPPVPIIRETVPVWGLV
jgi:hypothetical protein